MEEKIYTIPVTEAFEKKDGCPFCRLRRELEEAERDLIMGASKMEPDFRIKTNELGFCKKHYDNMLASGNKLSLALMLESHLEAQKDSLVIWKKALLGKDNSVKASEHIKKLTKSCYICTRVDDKYSKMLSTAVLLWQKQTEFRNLLSEQHYFCLPHASMYLDMAKLKLDKKMYATFAESLGAVQSAYMEALNEDVSWFCKKFDYRYKEEPWGNAKDSVERAVKFLAGDV